MSLLIGKSIYSILSGDTTLKSYVGDKIFPIFAPDEILTPFVVFERRNVNANYTKDLLVYDEVSLLVSCVSDNYTECINIANAVRNALESITGTYSGIYIYQSLLSSSSEDFGIDGFIITLEFQIKCK